MVAARAVALMALAVAKARGEECLGDAFLLTCPLTEALRDLRVGRPLRHVTEADGETSSSARPAYRTPRLASRCLTTHVSLDRRIAREVARGLQSLAEGVGRADGLL
jgi:hypothetical protein